MATKEAIHWFKGLTLEQKNEIALKAGISLGTLRNVFYSRQKLAIKTVLKVENASKRAVTRYQIAPEVDWSVF